jgi:predicted glycosyltransferase
MRRKALFYCPHSEKHIGALYRSIALAQKLSDTLDVTILLDKDTPIFIDVPEPINLVYLPSLSVDPDSEVLDSGKSAELMKCIIERRDVILDVFEQMRPRVVIVSKFPFKQQRLRGEALPMIERARNDMYGECLVVCTTDSIMVDESADGEKRADLAAELLDRYFDFIIALSDPVFARLDEFFKPKHALHTPRYHTGFVVTDDRERWIGGIGKEILVSAGNGYDGGVLFRTAVAAHRVLWPVSAMPMKIVTGPRLSEDEFWNLVERADSVDGLEVTRVVGSLRAEMARARCSVSQCDYHTALNAITTQTPSLFVPCKEKMRGEQVVRAQRLVYWGAGRLLMPHHLNVASLTNEINQLLHFEQRKIRFDMDGAAKAAKLIDTALRFGSISPESSRPGTDYRPPR